MWVNKFLMNICQIWNDLYYLNNQEQKLNEFTQLLFVVSSRLNENLVQG